MSKSNAREKIIQIIPLGGSQMAGLSNYGKLYDLKKRGHSSWKWEPRNVEEPGSD